MYEELKAEEGYNKHLQEESDFSRQQVKLRKDYRNQKYDLINSLSQERDPDKKLQMLADIMPKIGQDFEFFSDFYTLLNMFPFSYWSNVVNTIAKNTNRFDKFFRFYYGDMVEYIGDIFMVGDTYENMATLIDIGFNIPGKQAFSAYTFSCILRNAKFEVSKALFDRFILKEQRFAIKDIIEGLKVKPVRKEINFYVVDQYIKDQSYSEDLFNIIHSSLTNDNGFIVESYINSIPSYPRINALYSQKYQVNLDNLNDLIKHFGYLVINYINKPNIASLLNLDKGDFTKYIGLFDKSYRALDKEDINTVSNAFFQRQFRLGHPKIYNIFATFERLLGKIDVEQEEKIRNILDDITKQIDINKILNKYQLTKEELINKLLKREDGTLNIVHEITDLFIAHMRTLYCKTQLNDVFAKVNMKKIFEKNYFKKAIFAKKSELAIKSLIYGVKYDRDSGLTEEQRQLINNDELIEKIIRFKKDPKSVSLIPEEKQKLKLFETILNIVWKKECERSYNDSELESDEVVYDYLSIPTTNEYLLNIMAITNPEIVKKRILNNEKVYYGLTNFFNKYHLLGWNDTFLKLAMDADVIFDEGTISCLISYFDEIYAKITGTTTLTAILDYGNMYNYTSKRYRYLLGKEDYELIFGESGRNKSTMKKARRLEMAALYLTEMYERQYTTIPPVDANIPLENNKVLNVIVGNSTNTANLTMGERTDACLRIGGEFCDLFQFCLLEENGFHIRFADPNTNEFVSRVSGIRHGNTIFLNELRCSVSDKYSNADLYEALKKVCKIIMEESQKTKVPIDNFIITSDYALEKYKDEEVDLNIDDFDAFYDLNTNYENKGIILCTTRPNNELAPYNFNAVDVPFYPCQRDKIRTYTGFLARDRIVQLRMINELLGGYELEDIELDLQDEYEYCIAGEDWFIAKTSVGKQIEYIMPNSKNKQKAQMEMEVTLMSLEEKRSERKQ